MNALLLGAGASFECGLPLIDELTVTLKKALNIGKLKEYKPDFYDEYIDIIQKMYQSNMHYESMIGYFEVLSNHSHDNNIKEKADSARVYFIQAIHMLLLEQHVKNQLYCLHSINAFAGLKNLLNLDAPLWVFSLNHDLIMEMVFAKYAIPYKTGFWGSKRLNINSYSSKNSILVEELTRKNIDANNFDFLRNGETGVNLIKLHGGLDIFAVNDGKDYLKVVTQQNNPSSGLNAVKKVLDVDMQIAAYDKIHVTNEHCYLDDSNVIQFLRNSLLTGAHKFTDRNTQIIPPEFLSQFKLNINYAVHLICIGYGFGGNHINQVITEWLSLNGRSLTIVDPFRKEVPSCIAHLSLRVTILNKRTTEYFIDLSDEGTVYKSDLLKQFNIKSQLRNNLRESLIK
ncbi:MAG: hypothetical protein K2X04_00410 [Burkholderiales bacterium]|nr:hypothetical protein [Burkholderiales bacterium]